MREKTQIVRGDGPEPTTGSISVPIYRAATYIHNTLEYDKDSFYYSRGDIPTRRALEKQVAVLEHGADALAVTSGLAAFTSVLKLFDPGDRVIVSSDLYGGSYRLCTQIYERCGPKERIGKDQEELEANLADYIVEVYHVKGNDGRTEPALRLQPSAARAF